MADSALSEESTFFPGPAFNVDLVALDALRPVHYGRRLLVFHCISAEQRTAQLAALKAGLQALVLRCPLLGGTVVPQPANAAFGSKPIWSTIEHGKGFELVVRDLRTALPSFDELEAGDFQPSRLPYNLLVPVPQGLNNDRYFPACKLQYSAIDGGTIFTWAMSHSVADGSGNNELTRSLSEHARFAEQSASGTRTESVGSAVDGTGMGLDRSALRNIVSELPFRIKNHPGYSEPSVNAAAFEEASQNPFQASSPEVPILLRISAASLAKLKMDATQANAAPISTHDALVALMWRSMLLIRSLRSASFKTVPTSAKATLFFPSDARRHLGLPHSYIGNAVYQLAASEELSKMLAPNGLQYAANAIRRAVSTVSPALVTSYMAEVNKRWVDWAFMTAGTLGTTAVAMGTNWTSGSMYSDDWGEAFGPLIRFRYPGEEGLVGVMPKLPEGTA